MPWTTEIRYFIFWQVNHHFEIPFIISLIVCTYKLNYRMRWSGTIHNMINCNEKTLHENTKVKKVESGWQNLICLNK